MTGALLLLSPPESQPRRRTTAGWMIPTIFPTRYISGSTLLTTITLAFIILLGIIAVTAQQLLFCFRILRRTRCHAVHVLERSIHGLSYHSREGDAGVICSLAQVRFSFRIPTPSDPHFFQAEFFDVRYYGPWASGSCSSLVARMRLPGTGLTWCTTRLGDLRLTVANSEHIPDTIVRLRENLLRAIVLGKVHKLDHFSSSANGRLLWSGEGLGVVAEAKGYETSVVNRIYDFGTLKGSLMRDWVMDEGRFLLEAKDVRWYKAESSEPKGNALGRTIVDVLYYPAILLSSMTSACQQPASLLELKITHGELKFCKFRDRDHALEKHAMQFLGEWRPEWMEEKFLREFMLDTVLQVIAGPRGMPHQMQTEQGQST